MAQRKLWAQELQAQFGVSIAKSCRVVNMSRKAYYYKPKRTDDSDIIEVLNNIVEKHQRWGFPKCYKRIRKLGHHWNHKRVHRVYTGLKLNLRRKLSVDCRPETQSHWQYRCHTEKRGRWIL